MTKARGKWHDGIAEIENLTTDDTDGTDEESGERVIGSAGSIVATVCTEYTFCP
jgi:hypothetical protein